MNFNIYIKPLAFVCLFIGFANNSQAQTNTPTPSIPTIEKELNGAPLLTPEQLKVVAPNRDYADYIKANTPAPGINNKAKAAHMDALTSSQKSTEKKRTEKVREDNDGDQQ